MEEFWKPSTTPQPSTPTAGLGERPERSSTAEAKEETDHFAQAASHVAELMHHFVEEVGAASRDFKAEADSARMAHADAERIRQEAIELTADAEAEAIRIIDGARTEADGILKEAQTWAAAADRVCREIADDLERAQESLGAAIDRVGAAIDRVGADVGEPTASENDAVMPDASGEAGARLRVGAESPTE